MDTPLTKTCTKCGETKPVNDFSRRAALKSGYASQCKRCHKRIKQAKIRSMPPLPASLMAQFTEHVIFRLCTGCGNVKPVTEFNRQKNGKYSLSSQCKACLKEYGSDWYEVNSERRLSQTDDYRRKNQKSYTEWMRNWRKVPENKEKSKVYADQYRRDNMAQDAANSAKKRAAQRQATPIWHEDDAMRFIFQKREELSNQWGVELHVDHIVPLRGKTVCGLHCLDNLQLIEASINHSKNCFIWPDMWDEE